MSAFPPLKSFIRSSYDSLVSSALMLMTEKTIDERRYVLISLSFWGKKYFRPNTFLKIICIIIIIIINNNN